MIALFHNKPKTILDNFVKYPYEMKLKPKDFFGY